MIGLSLSAIGIVFLKPILVFFGASPAVLPYALDYMRIILAGSVFFAIGTGMNNFIRAEGNPKIAMNTMLIGTVTNIILDYIFIFPFGWGIKLLNLGKASLVTFSYLILILLQGSMYWFYRYILIVKKRKVNPKTIELFRFLRWLNMIILVLVSIAVPIIKGSIKDLIISIALFIFGIIEYINYYWYRLSYGKSGFNIRILLNTRLQKSSINKLISK